MPTLEEITVFSKNVTNLTDLLNYADSNKEMSEECRSYLDKCMRFDFNTTYGHVLNKFYYGDEVLSLDSTLGKEVLGKLLTEKKKRANDFDYQSEITDIACAGSSDFRKCTEFVVLVVPAIIASMFTFLLPSKDSDKFWNTVKIYSAKIFHKPYMNKVNELVKG